MDNLKIVGCSISCLLAEGGIEKCLCQCKGKMHGLSVPKIVAALCSPGYEKRCKNGDEGVICSCRCGGMNHSLYKEIPDFEGVRIIGYSQE